MIIPTEPIGSIPRPGYLIDAMGAHGAGRLDDAGLSQAMERAVAETVAAMEATGSPVITDGEQSKPSFATYPLAGLDALAPDGVVIPFEDGHTRQLPRLTAGPFRYTTYSGAYVTAAKRHASQPVKQAVIAPSAISLIYPQDGIEGYPRDAFIADLVNECEKDVRSAFEAGADSVQIDFTEGRLCCKLDPVAGVCCGPSWRSTTRCLSASPRRKGAASGFTPVPGVTRTRLTPRTSTTPNCCPICSLFNAGRFFVQMASEADRPRVLDVIARERRPGQTVFVGVTDPIDPRIESAQEVCERILEAAAHLGTDGLGCTDDCGFSPFGDDVSTARDTAFAKIRARVEGARLAGDRLG